MKQLWVDNVLSKMKLIVIGRCDYSVDVDLFLFSDAIIYCIVKIVMFWKLETFRIVYV